jgi:hypothetical protein
VALTPQNEAAFLREVDDELRRDQLIGFWQRWGKLLIAAIVIALAVLAGFLWRRHHQQEQAGARGEQFSTAVRDLTAGKSDATVQKQLTDLSDSDSPGYRAASKMILAAQHLQKNDLKGAGAAFNALAQDANVAQPFRDLALIRSVNAEFDTLPPATVIARLKPIAVQGNPWFGSAGEMVALSYLKLNQPAQAAAILAAVAKDSSVPNSIRARTQRLAAGLGVDVSAAQTSPVKE